MKPPAFDYESPGSLDEALTLLAEGGYCERYPSACGNR